MFSWKASYVLTNWQMQAQLWWVRDLKISTNYLRTDSEYFQYHLNNAAGVKFWIMKHTARETRKFNEVKLIRAPFPVGFRVGRLELHFPHKKRFNTVLHIGFLILKTTKIVPNQPGKP